jgi:hypothetical protein
MSAATSATTKDPAEIYRLLRERFAPMARFGGPLYAGIYTSAGISGSLYVGELSQWLWLPTADGLRPQDAILTDEAVSRRTDLRTVVGNLLRSARLVFDLYLEHLERIQNGSIFAAELGTYLTDDIALVVDAIALRDEGVVDVFPR